MKHDAYTLKALEDLDKLIKHIKFVDDFDRSTFNYLNAQKIRYFWSLYFINKYFEPGRLIDIGNYPGHLHTCVLEKGFEAYGIDTDPSRYPETFKESKDRTLAWDMENEDFPNKYGKFKYALCLEVFEHLHVNPLQFLRNLEEVLEKDALFLFSTPNLFAIKNRVNFILGKQTFEHPFSVYGKLKKYGGRGHQRLYSADEIHDCLETYGFTILNTWLVDLTNPMFDIDETKKELPDIDVSELTSFFRSSVKWKGRIRRYLQQLFFNVFPNFRNNIFVLARFDDKYDIEKFLSCLKKADPWIDAESYK
jgi:2-polyprenyl-3-methyl-5-hydroxy-6-metoxy-1,4-benzoquinol methylase